MPNRATILPLRSLSDDVYGVPIEEEKIKVCNTYMATKSHTYVTCAKIHNGNNIGSDSVHCCIIWTGCNVDLILCLHYNLVSIKVLLARYSDFRINESTLSLLRNSCNLCVYNLIPRNCFSMLLVSTNLIASHPVHPIPCFIYQTAIEEKLPILYAHV